MAKNNSIKAQVKELTDRLADGVQDLFTSEKYSEYLKTMSRFHSYSTRNTLLIHLQKPGATHVAGFRSWQTKFGRNVKKGEKGIRILAPTPLTFKREEQKIDPFTKQPIYNDDGLPETEEVEVHIPRFKAISVFDVSQTEGKPLPQLTEDLPGDVRHYDVFMEALQAVSPLPIRFEPLPPDTDGECRFGDSIALREGMSEIQTILSGVHEIAHAEVHDVQRLRDNGALPETDDEAGPDITEAALLYDRRTREVQAESISYAVCAYYGIETSPNSFGYLAEWSSGKELRELNASLDVIRKTSASLIEQIDTEFHRIAKERGIVMESRQADAPGQEYGDETGIEPQQPLIPQGYDEQSVHAAFEHLKQGDLLYLEGAVNPVQITGIDGDDVRVAVPEMALESVLTHEQVLNALRTHAGNHHFIDAAAGAELDENIIQNVEQTKVPGDEPGFPQDNDAIKNELANAQPIPLSEEAPPPGDRPFDPATTPDPAISITERNEYGYTFDEILPLQRQRALELYDFDYSIYLLHPDNTEALVFEREEIENHDGLFGLESGEWLESPEYLQMESEMAARAPQPVLAKSPSPQGALTELLKYNEMLENAQAPREVVAALVEKYKAEGHPILASEAALLTDYAVATNDKRLTMSLAEYMAAAGFEITFGQLNPALEMEVRAELELWKANDPALVLARDITQFYDDIDLYGDGRSYSRRDSRSLYQNLLAGNAGRTLSWLRSNIEPTRVERAAALADRIEALDFDTPYKLAEDIHHFIAGELNREASSTEIAIMFQNISEMREDEIMKLEVALRVAMDNPEKADHKVPSELLDRLMAFKRKYEELSAGEPMVKITFSESPHLIIGQTLPLSVANRLFEQLDTEQKNKPGYDKTDFTIYYTKDGNAQQYTDRYDIGDGHGSLIDYISDYALKKSPSKDNVSEHDAYNEMYAHFVPYLKNHCEIAYRQNQADAYLAEYNQYPGISGWGDLIQSARLRDFVHSCRRILNTRPEDEPFPVMPLPDEVATFGKQLAGMPMRETGKDFVFENFQDDMFAIYQLMEFDTLHYHRFTNLEQLHKDGNSVERENYRMMYAAPLSEKDSINSIIEKFNIDRPHDFVGHSASTSDILVFKMNGTFATFYLNGDGVIELPGFLGCEREVATRLAQDIDAFFFDYEHRNEFSDIVNQRLVTSIEDLEAQIVSCAPPMPDICKTLKFVVEHDEYYRATAAQLLYRLEAFNPPRHEGRETYQSIMPDEIKIFSTKASIYEGMSTFMDKAGNVYLGKTENCHSGAYNPHFYDNRDSSLYFVSGQKIHHDMLAGADTSGMASHREVEYFKKYQDEVLAQHTLVQKTATLGDKPSLLARLHEKQQAVLQGQDMAKNAPNHSTEREV